LTGRALAAATGWHFTRVSKIENGVQAPSEADIRDWCRACDADEQAAELLATALAVDTAYVEFRRQARTGLWRLTGSHTTARYEQTKLFRIYRPRRPMLATDSRLAGEPRGAAQRRSG
jgi:transcriptional regulator with XRE-family HTH domain